MPRTSIVVLFFRFRSQGSSSLGPAGESQVWSGRHHSGWRQGRGWRAVQSWTLQWFKGKLQETVFLPSKRHLVIITRLMKLEKDQPATSNTRTRWPSTVSRCSLELGYFGLEDLVHPQFQMLVFANTSAITCGSAFYIGGPTRLPAGE